MIHDSFALRERAPEVLRAPEISSLQRQLNLYGYRRIEPGGDAPAGSYYHPSFRQDGEDLVGRGAPRRRSVGTAGAVAAAARLPAIARRGDRGSMRTPRAPQQGARHTRATSSDEDVGRALGADAGADREDEDEARTIDAYRRTASASPRATRASRVREFARSTPSPTTSRRRTTRTRAKPQLSTTATRPTAPTRAARPPAARQGAAARAARGAPACWRRRRPLVVRRRGSLPRSSRRDGDARAALVAAAPAAAPRSSASSRGLRSRRRPARSAARSRPRPWPLFALGGGLRGGCAPRRPPRTAVPRATRSAASHGAGGAACGFDVSVGRRLPRSSSAAPLQRQSPAGTLLRHASWSSAVLGPPSAVVSQAGPGAAPGV